MNRIRVVAVVAFSAAVVTMAAMASGAERTRYTSQQRAAADELASAEVQVAALKSDAVFSVRVATGGDFGDQSQLAPGDELFDAISASDLAPEFRRQARTDGLHLSSYPGLAEPVDMVWLSALHDEGLLAFADLTESELQSLGVGTIAEQGATLHISVSVMRLPTAGDARPFVTIPDRPDDESLILLLNEYEEELGVDADDVVLDMRRTYDERRREEIDVAGLGDEGAGQRTAVAVLDYDDAADAYRSDRVLRWEYTETIIFAHGRYVISLYRTSASLRDKLPSDLDLLGLARAVSARLPR